MFHMTAARSLPLPNGITPPIRVLVVADNLLIRTGLTTLLTTQTDLNVVGQVAGGEALGDDLDVYRPEVVLYDLGYETVNSTRSAHLDALASALAGMPFVALLPGAREAAAVVNALDETTVYGLLLRDTPPDLMAIALNTVYHGLVTIDPALVSGLIVAESAPQEALTESLTPRELEVLQLLAQGLPNKTIALRLAISPNTVKFHINAILGKLDVQSRTEAVIRATRLGLVIL
jgi:DNA-binding NarL/FixJ family response regulator